MSISETEERITSVICNHFLEGEQDKLTVNLVSARAGISRQAFHKNYLHLKPYITGQRAIDELLLRQGVDTSKVIIQSQKLLRELESELSALKAAQKSRFAEFEDNIYTSLMRSDILTHRAKELTDELRKKALHVELLKRQVSEMEAEQVLYAQGRDATPPPVLDKNILVQVFKPDMTAAFSNISTENNVESYTDLKYRAVEAMQRKILKVLKHGTIRVIIFQERYLCSFDKFVDRYFSKASASLVIINLPLTSRLEVREFISALKGALPLEIYVAHCDSDAVINAQRGFMFGHVPEFEFKALAKESLPTIYDGYDKVTVFKIKQGD